MLTIGALCPHRGGQTLPEFTVFRESGFFKRGLATARVKAIVSFFSKGPREAHKGL